MDRPLLVYTTFPDVDTALSIGEALVRDRLIACINVLPGMRSVYAWKGAIEQGQEAVGILKSRKGLQDEVHRALKERHPYETPVVLFIEPTGADAATLEWLVAETAGDRP
ncbi:divalent-cation tolerance protein CutA [Microvirga sp. CF3016]|uniref:divalent-cation tolerance protein CutA n=1 Tax=Microvirga sp. CF3016 TaxID=3110181 RepID=UPI002E782637|nr:divalent-cation tolerance protein CutA [Microvirga sp. CF3016]MEE1613865.1 divalent-cation tolerance protein CutA [Microvirga sp. CF3016]